MVLVATSRNLDMREVLKHHLGPLPWALSNCDGTLKKTNKSTLARHIESRVAPAESIPLPSACIIDGMSLVNKIRGDNRTFGDIAESIFMIAIQSGNASSRIDIVFDVYKDNSIKTAEREGRGEATGLAHGNIVASQKMQQWRRLLRSSASKTALIKFFVKRGEMIHIQRSLAANYSTLHVKKSVSKSLKMAPRSLINLPPPKKKLTHTCYFIPNMLPVTIDP